MGTLPVGKATPFPGSEQQPTGLTPPPATSLSPAEGKAVAARPGSPLNLGGQGGLGKLQGSLWSLRDSEELKTLGKVAHGEPLDPAGEVSGVAADVAGMGGDLAGLVGSPFASGKTAALTAGSVTPVVRAAVLPYLAYQGAKMMAQGKKPEESEPDFLQRILLGGSMTTGSIAGMGRPVVNAMDFVNRARSLESINKASVGLLQGKLAPLATKIDALMENRVKTRAQAMEQADAQLGQQRGGQPTITPVNLTAAHAQHPSPTFETPKAANLFVDASQQLPGSTFSAMRDLRTRIGRTASALERSGGKANDARILWTLYDGISKDMEAHATGPLNMPGQWKAYNTDATAMFDIQKGKLGQLFDTQQYSGQHQAIRLFTKGETPAIGLINDLGDKNTTPTGEINLWKEHMQKLGLDPKELTDSLDHARTLSKAHDSFTGKGQMGGMWRVATDGGPTALLALGIYGAAHGMGIYGMMPYLMAIGATRGRGTVATKMEAGRTMKELEQSLPPEAFRVGRALSDQPLPTTGVNVAPPPPSAQTTPPVPPAPAPTTPPAPQQPAQPATAGATAAQPKAPTGYGGQLEQRSTPGTSPTGVERRSTYSMSSYAQPTGGEQLAEQVRQARAGKPSKTTEAEALQRIMKDQDTYEKYKAADQKTRDQMLVEAKNEIVGGGRSELAGRLKGARQSRPGGVWRGKR